MTVQQQNPPPIQCIAIPIEGACCIDTGSIESCPKHKQDVTVGCTRVREVLRAFGITTTDPQQTTKITETPM